MKLLKKVALGLVASMTIVSAQADVSTLKANLKKNYPATKVTSVEPSPIKGIYEVVLGKNLAYTDESGDYFLFGDVIRMKDQQNMTSPKRDELKRSASIHYHSKMQLPISAATAHVNWLYLVIHNVRSVNA